MQTPLDAQCKLDTQSAINESSPVMMQPAIEHSSEDVASLTPAFNLNSDNKTDVLISLLGIHHNSISSWTSQAYQMAILYVGLVHGSVAYFFLHPHIPWISRILLSIGLLTLGFLMNAYLKRAVRAHESNSIAITRCEAALRLHQSGEYLHDHSFLSPHKTLLHAKNLQFLASLQLFATIGIVCLVILDGFIRVTVELP